MDTYTSAVIPASSCFEPYLSLAAVPQTLAQTNKTRREEVFLEGWSRVPPEVKQKEAR